MSKAPIIGGVLAALVLIYVISPFAGAYGVAEATATGNPAQVAQRVDFTRLKRSLAGQITRSYFAISGRTRDLPPLARNWAMAVGGGAAEALLSEILTPENVAAFLNGRGHGLEPVGDVHGLQLTSFRDALSKDTSRVLRESYFMNPLVFVLMLPNGVGVDLRWSGTSWRLAGLELPRELADAMAREVLRREKAAA